MLLDKDDVTDKVTALACLPGLGDTGRPRRTCAALACMPTRTWEHWQAYENLCSTRMPTRTREHWQAYENLSSTRMPTLGNSGRHTTTCAALACLPTLGKQWQAYENLQCFHDYQDLGNTGRPARTCTAPAYLPEPKTRAALGSLRGLVQHMTCAELAGPVLEPVPAPQVPAGGFRYSASSNIHLQQLAHRSVIMSLRPGWAGLPEPSVLPWRPRKYRLQ